MYDLERLNKIIKDIEGFFKDLEKIGLDEDNIQNIEKLHASAMIIFGIMNRTINLAEEIIVKNKLSMPNQYSESFSILAKEGLVDKKLSNEIEKIIEKRGMFAHHYYDLEKKSVLKLSKEIYKIKDFILRVKKIAGIKNGKQ